MLRNAWQVIELADSPNTRFPSSLIDADKPSGTESVERASYYSALDRNSTNVVSSTSRSTGSSRHAESL